MTVATSSTTDAWDQLDALQASIVVDIDSLSAEVDGTVVQAPSVAELRTQLVGVMYLRFHTRHDGSTGQAPTSARAGDLTESLVAAIPHRTIEQTAVFTSGSATLVNGRAHRVARIEGLSVLVPVEDLVMDSAGYPVGAKTPSWRASTTPGYLLAIGERGIANPHEISRIYLPCDNAEGALVLWPRLLEVLGRSGVGYHAKCLSESAAFPRSDAVVAYVSSDELPRVVELLHDAFDDVAPPQTQVSLFATSLSAGMGIAEEPTDPRPSYAGLSFGQHRSRVLAETFLRAAQSGEPVPAVWDEEARLALINPRTPGLNLPG